jgi:hypothetical protein
MSSMTSTTFATSMLVVVIASSVGGDRGQAA